jgi:glycosyltransferase 2 family protein
LNAYRNPIYIAYAILGITIFIFGRLIVSGGIGDLELYLFRFFNGLPDFLSPIFVLISLFGTIGFVIVTTFIAVLRRHYSHAIKFLLAGGFAWFITKWLKTFEYRLRPSELLPNVNLREQLDSIIGYPSGHAAVVTAIGVVAYMYTPKILHPFITWTIILVCISRLYLGMHLPMDVIGGYGVGLAIASAFNYMFGDTQGKHVPTSLIKSKLSSLKINVKHVQKASVDARGSSPFFVEVKNEVNLFVKVVDKSNNVADWLFKLSRKVIYRRLEDESPFLTPKRELEHEAYVAGLAFSNGTRTPKIRGIFHIKEDMWAMAQEMIPGKSLDKIDASRINEKMLVEIWKQVKSLHNANIIHRDLRAANIFIDDKNEPWIIDFGFSEASVPKETFYRDTVELIASLSLIADPKMVVETAVFVVGEEELKNALPYLDYSSLSGATTKLLKHQKGKLDLVRETVKSTLGIKYFKQAKVKRVDFKSLFYIVIIGLALYVIIPRLGDLTQSINNIADANLKYLTIAILLSVFSYFSAAAVYKFLSFLPLNYMKTLLISISTSFTNRLLPAGGGAIATNIRYLQKSGYNTTQASSITAMNNLVSLIGHLTILFIVAGLSKTSFSSIIEVPVSRIVIIFAVLVLLSCVTAILVIENLRRPAKRIYLSVKSDFTKLLENSDRFFFSLFSAMLTTTFYALCLYVCALALGVEISILQAFFVFTIGITAASVTPTPGGIGGAEAGLVAGFVTIGLPAEVGLSIGLLYRLITFWLPIIPGFIAFNAATKKEYL